MGFKNSFQVGETTTPLRVEERHNTLLKVKKDHNLTKSFLAFFINKMVYKSTTIDNMIVPKR